MYKKITKAVIPAAGLSTRMLPVSKSVPKVMLPVLDKPAIQFLAEEAAASGITDILIITGRGGYSIEDHFDYSPELEFMLGKKNDEKNLGIVRSIPNLANIHYIRQKEPRGLGHAVLCAKSFVGDDDFAVMYGDDVIIGEVPALSELLQVHKNYGVSTAGIKQVSRSELAGYCSLKVEPADNPGEFYVYDMNEKPKNESEIFSDYAILGRVILTPGIFDILERQPPGANGEIQLTDAMKTLALSAGTAAAGNAKMTAKVFSGERHDMGSKFGFLRANIIEGLKHPETSGELRKLIKELARGL
ncbi:MAG: UTP--glucose-1-phosphate uridylyltransferase [Oscillospiraceae bacterium]|nr:UTP--glucose-1-phosphate uridylyltransferase [Oscillospiraceae bacterium]